MTSQLLTGTLVALLLASPAHAQAPIPEIPELPAAAASAEDAEDQDKAEPLDPWQGRKITIQHVRPQDKRGVNMFETSKDPGVEYKGFTLDWGAAFTSQIQNARAQQHRQPACRRWRQRQRADPHRLRSEHLDRQSVHARPARQGRPRAADVVPLVTSSQRDLGEGWLHPHRRLAHRPPAAQQADGVRHAEGRSLRDQLRRPALPSQ